MKQLLLLLPLYLPATAVLAESPVESLKADVGTWDAVVKVWPNGPEDQSFESKATETNIMVGDWLVSEFKGDFGGESYVGRGQIGYDPLKKKMVGTWIDNMSPHLSTMEGTWDPKTKTSSMISKGVNPESGEAMLTKQVTEVTNKNHKTFTMYMLPGGEKGRAVKMMEIKYTRKK